MFGSGFSERLGGGVVGEFGRVAGAMYYAIFDLLGSVALSDLPGNAPSDPV